MKTILGVLCAIIVATLCALWAGEEKIPELANKNLIEAWLDDQDHACDWPKLSLTPRNWLGKSVELGGWVYFKFGKPGIAGIYLYDNPESMRMHLSRRCVEISVDGFDALVERDKRPADFAMSLNGKCVIITGRFGPGPSTFTLGTLNDPLVINEVKLQ